MIIFCSINCFVEKCLFFFCQGVLFYTKSSSYLEFVHIILLHIYKCVRVYCGFVSGGRTLTLSPVPIVCRSVSHSIEISLNNSCTNNNNNKNNEKATDRHHAIVLICRFLWLNALLLFLCVLCRVIHRPNFIIYIKYILAIKIKYIL